MFPRNGAARDGAVQGDECRFDDAVVWSAAAAGHPRGPREPPRRRVERALLPCDAACADGRLPGLRGDVFEGQAREREHGLEAADPFPEGEVRAAVALDVGAGLEEHADALDERQVGAVGAVDEEVPERAHIEAAGAPGHAGVADGKPLAFRVDTKPREAARRPWVDSQYEHKRSEE